MALNVVIVSPEIIPFAKTGGLADVAGSLPGALKKLGCSPTLFMPLYREVVAKNLHGESIGKHVNVPLGNRTISAEIYKSSIDSIPIYFIKRDEFFDRTYLYSTPEGDYFDNLERFIFFSRAVLESMISLGIKPDVVHLNDWQSSLIPAYLKSLYRDSLPETPTVLTIHNIAYQGLFPHDLFHLTGLPQDMFTMEGLEYYGKINCLKAGIAYSDMINTVSETYSHEIQSPEYGCGLEGILKKRKACLHGILNGVDYNEWNPETDKFISKNFNAQDLKGKEACKKALLRKYSLKAKPSTPLVGMISRMAGQKGFDILGGAMDELMGLDMAMVILGTGEKKYHELFAELEKLHPDKLGVKIGFDNGLAHKIEAGCDMFCMPSKYEPCGLNQFYSLRYGTIPIVRATGGLDDTITDYNNGSGNGFKFKEYSARALTNKIKEAINVYKDKKAWQDLQKKAMNEDYSWERSAKKYISLYELAQHHFGLSPL